jgi:hypothetical protein
MFSILYVTLFWVKEFRVLTNPHELHAKRNVMLWISEQSPFLFLIIEWSGGRLIEISLCTAQLIQEKLKLSESRRTIYIYI